MKNTLLPPAQTEGEPVAYQVHERDTSGRPYWIMDARDSVGKVEAAVHSVRMTPLTPSPTLEPSDAEVERALEIYRWKLREYDNDFHRDDFTERLWEKKYGTNLHSTSLGEAWAMRAALIASRQ